MRGILNQAIASSGNEIGDMGLAVDELLKKVSEMEIEYWIGKKDNLIYRMQIDLQISDEKSNDKLAVELAVDFSDYNKPVTIKAPESSIDLQTIMQGLLYGGAPLF